MIKIAKILGFIMLLFSFVILNTAWYFAFIEDDSKFNIIFYLMLGSTLLGGSILFIGGLIAEQLASKKDE